MLLTLHILIAHLSLPCLILSSPHEPPHHSLTPRNPLAPFTAPSPFTAGAKDDASLLAATTPPINCNAARFGAHVRVRSARNALAKIPRGDRTMSIFAMRQVGHSLPSWVHILPYRFMSGKCERAILLRIMYPTTWNVFYSPRAFPSSHRPGRALKSICGNAPDSRRAGIDYPIYIYRRRSSLHRNLNQKQRTHIGQRKLGRDPRRRRCHHPNLCFGICSPRREGN